FFSGFSLSFVDPWNGSGGFGASSSQFVMLFTLQKLLTQSDIQSQNYEFLNQLRNTYREIASGASGLPPSGADVISQWMGGLTYLDISSNQVENIGWGFPH